PPQPTAGTPAGAAATFGAVTEPQRGEDPALSAMDSLGAVIGGAASSTGHTPARITEPTEDAADPDGGAHSAIEHDDATAQDPRNTWRSWALPGEPPPELFQGKRMTTLPAGAELDRFGTPEGNLTYVAGTPYEQRSLPADWVEREYHRYLLNQDIPVLTGIPVPWFNQPGGGTAYLLPTAIQRLLTEGTISELEADPHDSPALAFRARQARG
ncbi:MAG: TNT domain-containing protein, partial [Sciscionella sp.]